LSPEDLAQVLGGLPSIENPNVLVGNQHADDAAVYQLSENLAIVQTVDFFTPVVDDPYQFGAIAAANALSDVYAMGAHPIMALNIVAFPRDSEDLPLSVLRDILRGGSDKAAEAGVAVVGGHSIDDAEPKYGMCVTGTIEPGQQWTNQGAKVGDYLVLTKPLGVGIITTAMRQGQCAARVEQAAIRCMAKLNRTAAGVAKTVGIHACTDVTGFGLLGHLKEMLSDGLRADIQISSIPLLDGVMELLEQGYVPGGTRRNHAAVAPSVTYGSSVSPLQELLLCDAQTSGGLLMAVSPERLEDLMSGLQQAGVHASNIGCFAASAAPMIQVVT